MNSWEINIPYLKKPTSFCVQLEQCEPWAMPVFSFLIYILSIIFPRCTANWSHKLNDGWVTTLCRERLFKIWRLLNTIHQSPVNMAWKTVLVWTTVVPDFRKKGYMQCKPGITLKTTTLIGFWHSKLLQRNDDVMKRRMFTRSSVKLPFKKHFHFTRPDRDQLIEWLCRKKNNDEC